MVEEEKGTAERESKEGRWGRGRSACPVRIFERRKWILQGDSMITRGKGREARECGGARK